MAALMLNLRVPEGKIRCEENDLKVAQGFMAARQGGCACHMTDTKLKGGLTSLARQRRQE